MIGKTIKNILTTNHSLTALVPVSGIYPYVINENTTLPAVVYTVDSILPEYNKGGWANDEISFTVFIASKDYSQLQNIIVAVRNALELNSTGYSTQEINKIYFTSFEEGYIDMDTFFSRLTFNVIVNKY
jgi:hypothetical protein